jgi:hypothetical protein
MGSELLPFDEVAAIVATASALGLVLLAPLFISQRRDVKRLREWMEHSPEHPVEDLARSEALLDRAEAELERIYAERGEPIPGTGELPAVTEVKPGPMTGGIPAAARVTSERPALERITMERAALEPHRKWHRFTGRITQPRWLVAIGIVALAIAAAAIVGSEKLLEGDDPTTSAPVDPGGIEVAVLNATSASGLAGEISTQIEDSGFLPGDISNYEEAVDRTIVMFAPGQKRAAIRVAREIGGSPAVQAIDRKAQTAAGDAQVVVIVGNDRAPGG